ncbi:MAG TPA: rod-binding protein, partial [Candidatus Berkiella sp.]|nr:rod-binding protein [Candidatus Berkiella sp.]
METKYVNTFNYYDFSSLKQLKSEADSENEASLKVIASQLESVFLQMVMKNMQDANESFKSDIFSRDNEDFYQEMLNQQMALSLSKAGGIGLADMIVQQLKGAGKTLPQQTGMLPLVAQPNKIKNETEVSVSIDIQAQVETNVEAKAASSSKVNEFVEALLPIAKQVAGMIGIDPKLLIA